MSANNKNSMAKENLLDLSGGLGPRAETRAPK